MNEEYRRSYGKPGWNRCDVCGRFIPMSDFESGDAHRYLEAPDAVGSVECYGTLCREHAK
jgi:hypothetical protein